MEALDPARLLGQQGRRVAETPRFRHARHLLKCRLQASPATAPISGRSRPADGAGRMRTRISPTSAASPYFLDPIGIARHAAHAARLRDPRLEEVPPEARTRASGRANIRLDLAAPGRIRLLARSPQGPRCRASQTGGASRRRRIAGCATVLPTWLLGRTVWPSRIRSHRGDDPEIIKRKRPERRKIARHGDELKADIQNASRPELNPRAPHRRNRPGVTPLSVGLTRFK